MLPRLEAEHDLRLVSAVAAGTGSMKKAEFRNYMRRLTNQVRPRAQRHPTLGDLERMGVEVIREGVSDG